MSPLDSHHVGPSSNEHLPTPDQDPTPAALQSPILTLPPELLCHIFTLALPARTVMRPSVEVIDTRFWGAPWILGAPWSLGQVCQYWRTLALSLPNLWTSIVVPSTLTRRELSLLNTQLERSGNATLDLVLRFTSVQMPTPTQETPFDVLLQTLVLMCARWSSIQIEDRGWLPHRAFGALGPMPLLRELVFRGRGPRSYLSSYDSLKHAPRLTRVVLGHPGEPSIQNIYPPWTQITTYKATYPAPTHFAHLSAAANVIVECDLGFESPPSAAAFVRLQGETLTLPRLRRLVVTSDLFLDCLVAPALHELHVHGAVDCTLPFLQRSACVLTRLILFQCCANPADVIHLLQNVPALTTLCLDFLGPSDALLSALTIRPGVFGPLLCPELTALEWGDQNNTMDHAAFVDMVESRWRVPSGSQCSRLRFVRIYPHSVRMKSAKRRMNGRMQGFVEEGMDAIILAAWKGWNAMERWREY
ncbi:hypothetical protein C8R44DRAFT_796482 [Mycena epipterygia]|nr:hypothetical protein C8R44DRAFT_796482 [Mycena epipterygia]